MGYLPEYVFKNASGKEFRFELRQWSRLLTVAMFFGWKPWGTYLQDFTIRVPDGLDISDEEYIRKTHESWDGRYTDKEGQLVTEGDAFNLAYVLMRAMKFLPNEGISDPVHPLDSFEYENEQLSAIYCWSGKRDKVILKDFIHFCMGGEFNIH